MKIARTAWRDLCRAAALFFTLTMPIVTQAFDVRPVNGMWGINAESHLAIGRAFAIELTGNVVVMTMYGYNSQRSPTFYVAAGVLDKSNRMAGSLSEPAGGTCLGCAPTSGYVLSTPGNVTLEFTSSTTGFVTLPGESRKAISKGLITWTTNPSALYGAWVFNYISSTGTSATADVVELTSYSGGTANGSGIIMDARTRTACEQQTSGNLAGYVLCVRLTSTGSTDRAILVKWYGHEIDGGWDYGSSSGSLKTFTGRRLVSGSAGDLNIVTIKQQRVSEADEAEASLFRAAIEGIVERQSSEE